MALDEQKSTQEKYAHTLLLLLENEGFIIYQKILQEQVDSRLKFGCTNIICTEQDKAKHNFVAGEIAGLEFAIQLPGAIKREIEQDQEVEEANKMADEALEKENEHGY